MPSTLGMFLLITLVMASLQLGSFDECLSNSECPSDSCCLLAPIRYARPACRPFQQQGKACRSNAETLTTNLTYPDLSQITIQGVHYVLCPCANGLSCERGTCN